MCVVACAEVSEVMAEAFKMVPWHRFWGCGCKRHKMTLRKWKTMESLNRLPFYSLFWRFGDVKAIHSWEQPMITALIWSCDDCHELYAFLVTSTVVHLKFLGQSAAPPSGHGVATTHDTTPLGTDPGCTWPLSCSNRFLNVHDHPKRFLKINSTVEILIFFEQPLRFCQYQNRRYAGLPLPTTCGSASGEGAEFERIS